MATLPEVVSMFEAFGIDLRSVMDSVSQSQVVNAFEGQKILAEVAWAEMPEDKKAELEPTIERLKSIKLTKWQKARGRIAMALMGAVGNTYECCEMHSRLFNSVLDKLDAKENEAEFQSRPPYERVCRCGVQFTTRDPGKDRCISCVETEFAKGMPAEMRAVMGK